MLKKMQCSPIKHNSLSYTPFIIEYWYQAIILNIVYHYIVSFGYIFNISIGELLEIIQLHRYEEDR
jgi:hypothetical protein